MGSNKLGTFFVEDQLQDFISYVVKIELSVKEKRRLKRYPTYVLKLHTWFP